MLAQVELGWSSRDIVNALPREDWERLREKVWGLRLDEWPEGKERPSWYRYGELIVIDLAQEAALLNEYKIPYTIKKFRNTYRVGEPLTGVGPASHLHVHIPNVGLLAIDEVTWLEDACTQELQVHLDDGWRILAVCPPNGVRRPDYILGRTKE